MNKKTKIIFIIILMVGIIGIGYYFLFSKPDSSGNTVADNTFGWQFPVVNFPITGPSNLAYSDIRDPGGIPEGLPVRLKIPVIGVNSAIEDALITPDGKMDVPQGSVNVAWFALGPNPGKIGSAVIGGHFGIRNGVKFVFYDLDKLVVGDKVYIEDDKGDTLVFQVRRIELFERTADATNVFTSNDNLAHLNLITCEGIWNKVNGLYPLRRVVFTDAIPIDVVTTFTPSAGLSPDGVFGPLTRNKLIAELGEDTNLPNAGEDEELTIVESQNVFNNSSSFVSIFLRSIKSLFETPIDGLITVLLLVIILFVTFKIIRRT